MVHTVSYSPRDHLPHLPWIAAAAFSSSAYFNFLHPGHASHPDNAVRGYISRIRKFANSPDVVVRVALSDDADPWVDVGLKGHAAEETAFMRGKWVDGQWQSADLEDGQLKGKVCEGRVVGYTQWQRMWPEDPQDAQKAKKLGAAGTVWPSDSLWKKLDRAAYGLADAYFARVTSDPSTSAENMAMIEQDGFPTFLRISEPARERCKHAGHIWLNAIAIDPAFNRRGIGARLMRWGMERAEVEGCPIILIATQAGGKLYDSLGFQTYGTIDLPGLSGDRVMVYWPKSLQDDDAQERVVKLVEDPVVKAQDDAEEPVAL